MNACVERHTTTARFPRASSSPIAFSKCVCPSPLFPTNTSGLYFFPGRSRAARAALTATWFDGPTANAASGNAADGPGGGAAPARTFAAASSASLNRSGSRNTLWPAACGSRSATPAPSALRGGSAPIARRGGPRSFARQTENPLHRLRVDGRVVHRLERHEAVQRAHQLAHVADLRLRDRLQHARLEPRATLLRFAPQDRDPRLVIGRAHVHHQPARQPRDQP